MKPSTAATGSDVELNYRGCAITEEATGTYAATIRVSGRFSPRRSHCSFHFVGQRRRAELKKKEIRGVGFFRRQQTSCWLPPEYDESSPSRIPIESANQLFGCKEIRKSEPVLSRRAISQRHLRLTFRSLAVG